MALTLIKSGTEPNPVADQEEHQFTYAIYPHGEGWRAAGTVDEAYKLNQPLTALTGTRSGEKFSYADRKVGEEWTIVTYDMSPLAGKTIKTISYRLQADEDINGL